MTDTPKVEQRHRDAAEDWCAAWESAPIYDQWCEEMSGGKTPEQAAYAIGLAQGEQDGRRMERERLREAAARLIEHCEEPDQCLVCGELLDKPENDNGDGESLGHTSDCAAAWLSELMEDTGGTDAD